MNNKLYLPLLVVEFAFAISVVYSYAHKLSLIKQGQIFSTTTGMDSMVAELLSVVISIICIAFVLVLSQSKTKAALKTIGNFALLITGAGLICFLIVYSSGKIIFNLSFLYIILGSAFLKLRQSYRNGVDGALYNMMAYIFIYMGCFTVAVLIDLHTSDPSNPFPFADIDQAGVYDDTLTALIYYSFIGLIMPIVTIVRQFTKKTPALNND